MLKMQLDRIRFDLAQGRRLPIVQRQKVIKFVQATINKLEAFLEREPKKLNPYIQSNLKPTATKTTQGSSMINENYKTSSTTTQKSALTEMKRNLSLP